MIVPQFTTGVLSQLLWPGIDPNPRDGDPDRDDCWVLADLMCVHSVAPWVGLPVASAYRNAAGNSDAVGVQGGTIDQSAKAIRTFWPEIGDKITVRHGGPWATFMSDLKSGRPASLSVLSGSLPVTHGFSGTHRVAVYCDANGAIHIANPLAKAHTRPPIISEASLKKAVDDYPGTGVNAIQFPRVEAMLPSHPAYTLPADTTPYSKADIDAATKPLEDKIAAAKAALG